MENKNLTGEQAFKLMLEGIVVIRAGDGPYMHPFFLYKWDGNKKILFKSLNSDYTEANDWGVYRVSLAYFLSLDGFSVWDENLIEEDIQ